MVNSKLAPFHSFDGIRQKEPKPSDWRDDMTVCIAAICDRGGAIVSASDRMIALSTFTSADSMTVKGVRVHERWAAMFAADDIRSVDPILRDVTDQLRPLPGRTDEVLAAFREAYQAQVRRRVEDRVLSKYGVDLVTFRQKGLKEFGREVFFDLYRRIDAETLDVTFLVHGFEPGGGGRIFSVEFPGVTEEYGRNGFWAIGSGQDAALSSLFFHRYNQEKTLEEAIYHCCEAKFMAEKSAGVGKETILGVLQADQKGTLLRDADLAPIRKRWEEEGCPRLPNGITQAVSELVKSRLGPVEAFVA